jgi:uncharacterized protein (DUF1501 family)
MLNRRSFLQRSSLLALAPTVPLFLSKTGFAAETKKDSRILVVVQLDGGNDALNTLIPLKNEEYPKLRPTLKITSKDILKINDEFGLHPQMRSLDKLVSAGHVCALPGVGYPNPSRSHFESMAVWHSAKRDPEEHKSYGWLGRALDQIGGDSYLVGTEIPLALRGRRSATVSMTRFEDLLLADPNSTKGATASAQDDLLAFVARHSTEASTAAERIAKISSTKSQGNYPSNGLGNRLKLVSQLLRAEMGTRIFYTTQGGYDTHSSQQFNHGQLLNEFASSVAAFFADLKEAKLDDRVTLLAFSEFGRTIKENGSAGTDHGTAGVSLVIGGGVKGGIVGTLPSLTELKEKEPIPTTDFRRLYASVLSDWLGVEGDVLQGKYETLPVFKS